MCSDGLRPGRPEFDSRQGQGICSTSQLTKPPVQWVPGAIPLVVKRPGSEADHSPPPSAEVKNVGTLSLLAHNVFMSWCFI
jgi:hypothetical protein